MIKPPRSQDGCWKYQFLRSSFPTPGKREKLWEKKDLIFKPIKTLTSLLRLQMETLQQEHPVGTRLTLGFVVTNEFGQSRIEKRKKCPGLGPLGPHCSTYHVFYDFILPILPLHLQQVVAEVEEVKAPLLSKENNDGATCPVETISKALPGGRNRVMGRER